MFDAVMPTYARYDLAFERGEGAYLWDTDGRRYLDFGAGIAVASLGHCHPHLIEALTEQAKKLWHTSNLYGIPGQSRLAERLVANSFADAVFFNNSGNEAVELALKIARKYHNHTGHAERFRVVTVEGAFHGRSLACLAAGRQEKHMAGFGPLPDGYDQVAFGNLNEMRNAIGPATAAILVEPVQGESGIKPMDADYLKGLREICDEYGLLLMYDEVQCGMGRTGKLFAHEWADVPPDVLATAKGIGGGFPMGATLATERVAQAMTAGSHGSTFGGNPLAMAVGNAVLDVLLEDGFMETVTLRARRLRKDLETVCRPHHPGLIDHVRGQGLMLGLKCADGAVNGDVVKKLMAKGLLTVPAGDNVVRIVPPLTIEESHIDEAVEIVHATLSELAQEAA